MPILTKIPAMSKEERDIALGFIAGVVVTLFLIYLL